jgi:hypothetical protein
MNWDALGAIAELAAAATVVATLIYLSQQIRQAAKESRLSAIHDISSSYIAWIQSVATNQDLSRIWDEGLINYEQLKHEDRVRFLLIMGSITRILDDAYGQYSSGRMEKEDWAVYENVIDLAAGSSGFRAYISQRKFQHTLGFALLIKEKMSSIEALSESLYR